MVCCFWVPCYLDDKANLDFRTQVMVVVSMPIREPIGQRTVVTLHWQFLHWNWLQHLTKNDLITFYEPKIIVSHFFPCLLDSAKRWWYARFATTIYTDKFVLFRWGRITNQGDIYHPSVSPEWATDLKIVNKELKQKSSIAAWKFKCINCYGYKTIKWGSWRVWLTWSPPAYAVLKFWRVSI